MELLKSFELMPPVVHFYLYLGFSIVVVLVLKDIFKKNTTYYVIFLSIILLFSCFSKDMFTYLPYDPSDVTRIIAKGLGSGFGVFSAHLWIKQRKNKNGRLI